MKKLFMLVLMALVGIGLLFSNVRADSTRTIPHKTKVAITGNTVMLSHSATIFKVMGYSSAANGIFALVDLTAVPATVDTAAIRVEGGEATQYDSMPMLDFGKDGLEFYTGVTCMSAGMSIVIEYI